MNKIILTIVLVLFSGCSTEKVSHINSPIIPPKICSQAYSPQYRLISDDPNLSEDDKNNIFNIEMILLAEEIRYNEKKFLESDNKWKE